MRLFLRRSRVTVGTLQATNLDLNFHIEKSLKREANTATIEIMNLSAESRRELAGQPNAVVRLEVGHGAASQESLHQIFLGDLRRPLNERDDVDWRTVIRSADGIRAIRNSTIAKSFRGRVDLESVIRAAVDEVAKHLPVGAGRALQQARGHSLRNGGRTLRSPVLMGSAWDELSRVLASMGLEVSIQDGMLQILPPAGALNMTTEITPESGLVGTPEIIDDRRGYEATGMLAFKAIIQPGLDPGYQVRVKAKDFDVRARIDRVTYDGETSGNEWYALCEGKPLSTTSRAA